ncbi:flagellar motor protein [Pseudoalteromonas sp. MMG010]|uniref:flagellar motor protein n=1 Tax=Pseudoalteromonas sp. MMG010 TaxID=2822685 RepID=UPI001B3A6D22|nr:flagellar motor protein [Pseudoalteromonas sp. MMG010]
MDKLSVFGLLLALAAIAFGFTLEGGILSSLINLPALIIVLGGTLGAVLIQTSAETFKKLLEVSHWVFFSPKYDIGHAIDEVKKWSHKARQEGYLALEPDALSHADPYAAKGLSLLVDGSDEQIIRDTLEIDLILERERLLETSRVYEAMGGYSPTIGIIGAVLGLIQAMSFITAPEKLGSAVATAFIATIYGVGFANILFLPIAKKLQNIIESKMLYHEIFAEGVIAISRGESPLNIELKLEAYRTERPHLMAQ